MKMSVSGLPREVVPANVGKTLKIQNRFELPVPPDAAWTAVTDLPRVASCLPGAQVTGVEPDGTHRGTVSVALGPASLSFTGQGRIVEADPEARRLVIQAAGGERRGRGRASATIHVSLSATPEGTGVDVDAALDLSGSIAQFGRRGGMLEDVSELLIDDFVVALREEILHGEPTVAPLTAETGTAGTALPPDGVPPSAADPVRAAAPASVSGLSGLIPDPNPTAGSPASRAPAKPPKPSVLPRPQPASARRATRGAASSKLSAFSLARKLALRRLRRVLDRLRRRPGSGRGHRS